MEGEDEIEIGQVDCGTSKPVCSKVDIHSYPTFKLFYNGEEVAKYQGKLYLSFVYKIVYWCLSFINIEDDQHLLDKLLKMNQDYNS